MFNQAILIGRLTKDAEVRQVNDKLVASVSLATSKKFKGQDGNMVEKTEYHNLVIWNNAETFATYTRKGSLVFIKGELQTRSWEKDGIKRYTTEIVVNEFKFLDKAPERLVELRELSMEQVKEAFPEAVVVNGEIPF